MGFCSLPANIDHPTSLHTSPHTNPHTSPHTSPQARVKTDTIPAAAAASTATKRGPGMILVTAITVKRRAGMCLNPLQSARLINVQSHSSTMDILG